MSEPKPIGGTFAMLAPERTEDRPTLLTMARPPQPWTKFADGGAEWRRRHNQERREAKQGEAA